MKKVITFTALIFYFSLSYSADSSFLYYPETSFPVSVEISDMDVVAHYPDGSKQFLWDKDFLKEEHIIEDYNFDGYKDLAILLNKDKRGLHSEYQIFYWNQAEKKLKQGKSFVNPLIEGGFLTESYYGYLHYKNRYRWNSYYLQIHSRLTMLDEDKTEITFFQGGKAVKKIIVASERVNKVLESWNN